VHPRFGDTAAGDVVQPAGVLQFLFFFRGWGKLAAVISVATIITYLVFHQRHGAQAHGTNPAPASAGAGPANSRAHGLRSRTLMLFWARWPHTGEIMLLLILPMPVYLYYQGKAGWPNFDRPAARFMVAHHLSGDDDGALLGGGARSSKATITSATAWINSVSPWPRWSLFFGAWKSGWRTPAIERRRQART